MKELTHDLETLASLESQFREEYEDEYLIKQINLHKKSLLFFLRKKDFNRSRYECNSLMNKLIYYLID
jgi:hypothetical protein